MVQTQDLMSEIQMGGWSEEEYLLGYDKCSSNTYFNNQDDLPGSSDDKDVYHKRIRMMGTHKYLKESYYDHIECIAATFLTVFMIRRLLNEW